MTLMPTFCATSLSRATLTTLALSMPKHQALAAVFNQRFGRDYKVRCIGGYAEPEYLPAGQTGGHAELRYTRDYPASALHEIAHWCIAGERRLACADFGYTYLPPPRDGATQQRFFAQELKVQTLEAWFALGTGVRFTASADNFECSETALMSFAQQILTRVNGASQETIPIRAQQFAMALQKTGLGQWPLFDWMQTHD